jgi:hypothetical protein
VDLGILILRVVNGLLGLGLRRRREVLAERVRAMSSTNAGAVGIWRAAP